VTPGTAQGTAFQEDRRADTRSIVDGKLFNVEDHASFHSHYSKKVRIFGIS
jgi:hypothetical protein